MTEHEVAEFDTDDELGGFVYRCACGWYGKAQTGVDAFFGMSEHLRTAPLDLLFDRKKGRVLYGDGEIENEL